ncbi:type VII secretion-associated serine protease mycosin [Actinocorallia lasiicapitis]
MTLRTGLLRAAAALSVAASTVLLPAGAVHAAGPRADQWWFPIWGITEDVWRYSKGKGVIVAVLDTKINGELASLRGALLPGKDFSKGERSENPSHGTTMAALIAARGTGPDGFYGVAPEAKILPIVRSRITSGDPARIGFQGWAKEIRYAVDQGADIINMSFGRDGSAYTDQCEPTLQEAVSYAIEHDVILVVAAGNDPRRLNDSVSVPGVCAGVITVGGMAKNFRTWRQTYPANYMTFAAPAVDTPGLQRDGSVRLISGTSVSAALVSGLFALLRSALPDVPSRELVRRVIATTADAYQEGWDTRTGYGVPVIDALVRGRIPPPGPNKPYERYDAWKTKTAKMARPTATLPPTSEPQATDKNPPNTPLLAAVAIATLFLLAALFTVLHRRFRRRNRSSP